MADAPPDPSARRPAERGTATPMIVGFAVVLLLTVAVVIDASAAFLHRQGLDTLADGAALFGAEAGGEGGEVYSGGLGDESLELTTSKARAGVRSYLVSVGAYATYPGLHYEVSVRDDHVVVRLTSPLDLPLTVPGAPDTTRVSATGRAEVHLD